MEEPTRGGIRLGHAQVAASWVLAGGEPSHKSVNPKKAFDPAAHAWGTFELAARYHKQELEDATFPTFGNLASSASAAEAWAVGFNWYFNRNLRLMFDYEDTSFTGGAATGDREDEKVFFSRHESPFALPPLFLILAVGPAAGSGLIAKSW